jgi:hypothetical protein
MTLNGHTFEISNALGQGLYYLRLPDAVRILWVDAICINQNDIDDKGKQVSQMAQVYRHAQRVVAWLGVPRWNSSLALDFAETLYASFPENWRRGTEGELANGDPRRRLGDEHSVPVINQFMHKDHAREWLALLNLFGKRLYWTRAWIFQEILLAKRLLFVCGPRSSTWGVVQAAMEIVRTSARQATDLINNSHPIPDQDTLYPINQQNPYFFDFQVTELMLGVVEGRHYMKNYFNEESLSNTTERWLELINIRGCKYPHDRIYGIFGLISPSITSQMLPPRYDWPVQEVFKQFARAYILGTNSLNILCFSHHSDTQWDLPSWVLDWRRDVRLATVHDIAGVVGTRSQRAWHATALASHLPTFSSESSRISVRGIRYGIVKHVRLEHEPNILPQVTKMKFTIKDTHCDEVYPTYEREWWDLKDYAAEMLGDAPPDSKMLGQERASTLLRVLLARRDPSRLTAISQERQTWCTKPNNLDWALMSMLSVSKCRTAIETDGLDVALAPMWTKPGDILCQFVGCTAAVILEPLNGGVYKFIGGCYVLGKMGDVTIKILEEAMMMPEKLETFTLV